jgi:hypothetical protein
VPIQPFSTQRFIPWPEAVTVTSVRPNSSNVVTSVSNAGVYRLSNGEASPSFGVYTKNDIRVTIGQDDFSFTPKPRDTVLWKGDTYTVLEVGGSDWLKFWTLTARNLILAADLRQTGTLSRPSAAQDSTLRPGRASYSTVTDNIPCRLQPVGGTAGDNLDKRTIPQRFAAIVGVFLDARAGDRFTVSTANYTVISSANPERIDELQSLTLEVLLP